MTDSLHERVVAALGRQYSIGSEIGRGGMSVVYRARDLRLNRTVAVKVLPPELAYDPAVVKRFTREAQTSAQLSHPHIVPIFDVGERDGIAYFVMALVSGGNLAAILEQHALRSIDEVRRVIADVADALAYAHSRGVIHRDIKADNILLDGDTGRAMVTDFGIARAIEGGSRLTVTGIAVGTPAYMSPEQAVGDREVDGRSDVYSLGVLAYQMVTGRVPFSAGNPMALLLKHVTERPVPIADLRPEAPRPLIDAIERALMKSPADRWPTAAAFRDAILANEMPAVSWRTERREPVRYTSPIPRNPRRETRALAAGGELALLALVPPHLASLTEAQREDLRLWSGRINLLDRVKATRRYALATTAMVFLGIAGFVAGVSDVPPLVLSPLVPAYMLIKLRKRSRSLRQSGITMRKVLMSLRSRSVLPDPESPPAVRRAEADRAAILEIVSKLPKADRAALPDIVPTVNALMDRVTQLARLLVDIDAHPDPRLAGQRDELAQQIDHAGVALGNLRLDLIRLQASGIDMSAGGVSSATQEARALSRHIDAVLEAAAEVRTL